MAMRAGEILAAATEAVDGDREKTHGDKLMNHQNIAVLWDAYLRIRPNEPLTVCDVALMMALLKIARTHSGEHNPDDYVDLAGYAACAGEMANTLL